jgi:hypothetical protein
MKRRGPSPGHRSATLAPEHQQKLLRIVRLRGIERTATLLGISKVVAEEMSSPGGLSTPAVRDRLAERLDSFELEKVG